MLNIIGLISVSLLIIFGVLLLNSRGVSNGRLFWWYFGFLCILLVTGSEVVSNYFNPSINIFNNTDYHTIEHRGFRFKNQLSLVDSERDHYALWDEKDGKVNLTIQEDNTVALELTEYYEPFYVSSLKKKSHILRNDLLGLDVSEYFRLETQSDTLEMKIVEEKNDFFYLVRNRLNSSYDTSVFQRDIRIGYPLLDILLRTPRLDLNESFKQALEGVYLLRNEIPIDSKSQSTGRFSSDEKRGVLSLFPSGDLLRVNQLTVSNKYQSLSIDELNTDSLFQANIHSGEFVFSGIGLNQTKLTKLKLLNDTIASLDYVLPKMYQLRDESLVNHLFITSSTEVIERHQLEGGYFLNIFKSTDNRNHIDSEIKYKVSDSRTSMKLGIKDFIKDPTKTIQIEANEEFELSTNSATNSLTWVLQVKDLKSTNFLTESRLNKFMVLFLGLVLLRIFFSSFRLNYDSYYDSGAQQIRYTYDSQSHLPSPLEFSIYVVVFTMLVMRFILLWRTSTFVPIENIDVSRYNTLRASSGVYKLTVLFAYGFVLGAIVLGFINKNSGVVQVVFKSTLLRKTRLAQAVAGLVSKSQLLGEKFLSFYQGLLKWIGFRSDNNGFIRFLFSYLFLLVLFLGLGELKISSFERILNIFAPTTLFLGSIFFLYRQESKGRMIYGNRLFENDSFSKGVLIFLLGLFTLGYFALKDAGFSIIFLLFGIIIFWLRFALYNKGKSFETLDNNGKLFYVLKLFVLPTLVIYTFVYVQAQAIVFIIDHLHEFILSGTLIVLILALLGIWHPRWARQILIDEKTVKLKLTLGVLMVTFAAFAYGFFNQDKLNNKFAYIKYRAEVQYNDTSLEELIYDKKYESSDIEYILRSVHNQWFINLYNDSPDKYFELRPHFNQGSSYTTQTTDLAVLRFVIAEHSKGTVFAILFLIGSLVLVHLVTKGSESVKHHQLILMALCLPVCIGFFVTLTATNRIIFFGQDFPLLSITSNLAVLMPLCIYLLVVILKSENNRVNFNKFKHNLLKGGLTYLSLLFFFSICFLLRQPSNADDSDISSFDITGLIDRYEPEIKKINSEFLSFQASDPGVKPLSQTIQEFNDHYELLKESDYYKLVSDSVNNPFLWSLMKHFTSPLTNKWDQNELLHIRQRGDYYHIKMNKKYYFLSSFKERENAWRGDVLATQHRLPFNFYKKDVKVLTKLDLPLKDYYTDVLHKDSSFLKLLPVKYQESFQNANVTYLSSKWTPENEPLYLVSAQSGNYKGNKPLIKILNDTSTIEFQVNAPSVRLFDQDYLAIGTLEERKERNIFSLRYSQKNQSYLAKNLWMNNGRRLYYPLGKESIWTYHLSNMIASTWKEKDEIDSSMTVSLDYDLTKRVYGIVDQGNSIKESLSYRSLECVNEFKNLSLVEMRNPENKSCLYLKNRRLIFKGNRRDLTNQLTRTINKINRQIRGNRNPATLEGDINEAIDFITEKRFDYSAVAIDGRGRIRLLFDYNKNDRPDPNNNRLYNRLLSQMYQKSTYADESDFFGNKAIMKLNPGPGSSFKPIVLSSVTAMYNLGWDRLRIKASTSPHIFDSTEPSKDRLIYYGGKSLRKLGTYWSLPRYNVTNPIGLAGDRYMVSSNNLLHSLIIFMGAYDKEKLVSFTKTGQLPALKSMNKTPVVDSLHFPVIEFYNRKYAINPDNWLHESSPDFFTKKSSILSNGLLNNYHIYPALVSTPGNYEFSPFALGDSRFKQYGNLQWVFPEVSTFYQTDRKGNPAIRNGLFQPTLGAYPISVTPFKMAEASMRLLTIDAQKDITSLNPNADNSSGYQFFHHDSESWGSADSFLNDHRNHILGQMFNVMRGRGTAWRVGAKLWKYEREGYFFYGKTGTINSAEFDSKRDKHLMVMVTRKRLHDLQTPVSREELKNLKYYSIYLSYHGIEKAEFAQGDNFAAVISAIMDSELFRAYMENDE